MLPEDSTSVLDTGVQPCLGLKITANAGISFTDAAGRVYDLETQRTYTPEEAAEDARLSGLGFGTLAAVRELIRAGRLYPVFKKNARVFRVYDCALTDFRARQLAPRHLAQQRAERVA